jgi:transposase
MSTRSKRNRRRSSPGAARPCEGLRQVTPHAAGVDIGAQEIMACVPDGDDPQIVRPFGTYTADLDALADWVVDRGIQTVDREATGVYWMPLFETLEARGLLCCLVSAPAIKYVPGRQSDVLDCQWMQTLQRYGLLKASLRPDAARAALRTLFRHRAQLIQQRALLTFSLCKRPSCR